MSTPHDASMSHSDRQDSHASLGRRDALAAIGLSAMSLGGFASLALAQDRSPTISADELPRYSGFDRTTGLYMLPPLLYAMDALEPHIDAETMALHHGKHHASYVKGLNDAIAALAEIRSGKRSVEETKHWERQLAFHGSGHLLHVLFWHCMGPDGGSPTGLIASHLEKNFGSFEQFSEQFKACANAVEGSGWAILVFEPASRRLLITQAEKHQNQAIWGTTPLLAIDVWEHAYYLRYQNRRADYVNAFMNVINWQFVNRSLELQLNGGGR